MDSSDNFAGQVIFQKSPVTKFQTRLDALIRGQVHEDTEGVFDFFCEATYDTEGRWCTINKYLYAKKLGRRISA